MKITKRIIIRIIVTVAVAIILSKLKLIGVLQVNALTRAEITATQFCVYWRTPSSNPTCDNNLKNSTYYGRPFQTYSYMGDTNFESVSFLLNINTNIRNKNSYWSGVFFSSAEVSNSTYPIRAYIDNGNNSFACKVESTTQDEIVGIGRGYLSTISCDNVVVLNETPRLFITGPFANYSSTYGINKWAAIYDNDNLLAQETANQYLNDLKTLTNSTNSKLDQMIQQQQQSNSTQNDIKNNTKETNDLIKSDDTTESNAKGKEFFDNFENDSHGLSGIITAPFRLLNSLTTQGCSPLNFDLPFDLGHVSLPCMRGIYEQHFGIFFSLWQMITTGLISYNVILNIYSKVRSMQNPYNDRIEVLNL